MKRRLTRSAIATLTLLLALQGSLPAAAGERGGREITDLEAVDRQVKHRSPSLGHDVARWQGSSKLVIVQFTGPIEEAWKDAVERMGVKLAGYLPDFAFLAKLPDKSAKRRLEALPFVEYVRAVHPVEKLSPELAGEVTRAGNGDLEVAVIGADPDERVSRTVRQAAPDARPLAEGPDSFQAAAFSVDSEDVMRLLESDDVLAILPVRERQSRNWVARDIIESDRLTTTGYTGKNQIVGVADTGLDTGQLSRLHKDFQGRVRELIPIGRPGDASDPDGHGTHVAGSIVGTGKASRGKYQGMAPDAQLVFHSMSDEQGRLVGHLYEMWEEAYEAGARIHSDSWGIDDFGSYSLESYLADQFLWEHKEMTALVAAGNAGATGPYTVGSPATAKNVIAVGASESKQKKGGKWADNPDEVASFSSRGPTLDGRIKPDLVAPGTFILSTRSSLAPDERFDATFNKYYAYLTGTSMATPVLAGGVAQIRQYLQEHGHDRPSSALIKAMLVTSARDLGVSLFAQGFGRADLNQAIQTDVRDETEGLSTHDRMVYTVDVTDDRRPFIVTLAWTDYPAFPLAGKALVNDLHLVVRTPSGEVYNGNDFHAPHDDRTDKLNNVEQVYLPETEEGTYTVEVIGYNMPFGPQPYALATTGTWREEREDADLVDVSAIKASVKLSGSKYRLSVSGSLLSRSVERVTIRAGESSFSARIRNGSFSLNRSFNVNGRYLEDVVIEAKARNGDSQTVTVPVESEWIADEPVIALPLADSGGVSYEIRGSWTGRKPSSVYVVSDGETIPLKADADGFSGIIPGEWATHDAVVVAEDRTGSFEVERVVFP